MIDPQEIAAWTSANLLARHEYRRVRATQDGTPKSGRAARGGIDPYRAAELHRAGLSWQQVAIVLGCTKAGVLSAVSRARKRGEL